MLADVPRVTVPSAISRAVHDDARPGIGVNPVEVDEGDAHDGERPVVRVGSPSGKPSSAAKVVPSKAIWRPICWPTAALRGSVIPKKSEYPCASAARSTALLVASLIASAATPGYGALPSSVTAMAVGNQSSGDE